eukprot:Nitzschia sp. Nitz4//scaffold15_size197535//182193//183245//NITZ4_001610-RA/size197535-processed-gene-0.35-mRNA-1//1//CDS//3329537811//8562//frame0
MTADTVALVWGSALIGFAPFLCFFFQITYPKSQLLIIFMTAAFFYLLSCLGASFVWYILDPLIGLGSAWSAIVPGVISQFLARCLFATLYIQVEDRIQASIEKTEQEHELLARQEDPAAAAAAADVDISADLESAKLKLALNDSASSLAAGTGFGGMHAIMLFGSLLASETADFGVLYQPSCPYLPSLFVSGINTFLFFFLDLFWMQFTFFGIRRRIIFPRGGGTLRDMGPNRRRSFGAYYGNTRSGGNAALLTVLISHFIASGCTTFNNMQYGCAFSLSLLPVVVLIVAYLFWSGVSKVFLPTPHSNVRLSLPASFSYGSRAEGIMNGDDDDEEEDDVPRNTAVASKRA